MKLSTRWTSNLKEKKEKEEFTSQVLASRRVLDRLKHLVEASQKASVNKSRKEDNFTLPAWSEHQAYQLGYQAAIDEVVKLINLGENNG